MAGSCVHYLLKDPENQVFLADQYEKNVDAILGGHSRGIKKVGNIAIETKGWIEEIAPDLVIGLLPKNLFTPVARICVDKKKSLVLPSYPSPEIYEMRDEIKDSGISVFVELGVDPGIDHMSACSIIENVHSKGGKIESFWSVCGSLPSQEANNNPMGYKVSWAPSSVVLASRKDAAFLMDGKAVRYENGETYKHTFLMEIDGEGTFECYGTVGDSLVYADLYNIPEAGTIFRGTLRYLGWSETVTALRKLGYFGDEVMDMFGMTFGSLTRKFASIPNDKEIVKGVSDFLGVAPHSAVMLRLGWLGLFDEKKAIPITKGSTGDVTSGVYMEKMSFQPGERDLVLLQHRFDVKYENDKRERIYSILSERGTFGEETAIAKTTGLPVAMGAALYLQKKYVKPGLVFPTVPEIYKPVLKMLADENIVMRESVVAV